MSEVVANRDPRSIPIEQIDVADPTLFESYSYHPLFRRLRAEDPVHYAESPLYGPYWSVTRYEDIDYVEKRHATFSSALERGGIAIQDAGVRDVIDSGASFITMDPPRHTAHRGMVRPAFTPANLAQLEDEIRERVVEIVKPLPVGETFDWVRHVSNELPIQMLATLFGVPQADRHKLLRWSNVIIGLDDPEVCESREQARAELSEFAEYCFWLWRERADAPPGADLVSLLAHGEAGADMSPEDYIGTMMLLVVGGNDTTRNSITGGLHALMHNPAEYEKLRQDRSLIPRAVNEIIRWVSPVAHMRRTAVEDTELGGKTIRAGDKVVMWYVSGNRDERAFEDPDTFRVDRQGPRHLAFGRGIHFCIGARLAEMQLKCLWEELLGRHPVIEPMGEPSRLHSNFISGFKRMPVRIPAG